MKRNFLKLFAVCAAAVVAFASCEKAGEDGNGGIKNPDNNGGDTEELHASLKGSAYVPVVIDENSAKAIEKKIVVDLRVDDVNNYLYVWDKTYVPGEGAGLNFYGDATGYTSLIVSNIGWSGAGFCRPKEAAEAVKPFVKKDLKDWYFHLAYKPAKKDESHAVIVSWNDLEYKFALCKDFVDGNNTYKAIKPVDGDFVPGEWNEYEIPLSEMSIDFEQEHKGNYVAFLSGGTQGDQLNVDAVFFYKK